MADGGAPRSERMQLAGGCHCGSLAVRFATACAPTALTVRACACSFCRRHGVRTVSDPKGQLEFLVRDPAQLNRYRFGLATAEFLICRRCGVYLGALMSEGGAAYAIVNINALTTPEVFAQAPVPVSYDRESAAERRARRRAGWTPAALIEGAGAG